MNDVIGIQLPGWLNGVFESSLLSGVLLMILYFMWKKLEERDRVIRDITNDHQKRIDERDVKLEKISNEVLETYQKSIKVQVETKEAIKSNTKSVEKLVEYLYHVLREK